ncbi:MAG: hypothetical protein ACOCV2_08490 [Persicimonas sp.]
MWQTINSWASRFFSGREPRVWLGGGHRGDDEVVIEVPFGDASRRSGAAARLCGPLDPGRVRRIVRHAARRRLPVDAWLVRQIWCVPARPEALARWLIQLEREAGGARLHVELRQMPPDFRRRLLGNLRRFGCRFDRSAA